MTISRFNPRVKVTAYPVQLTQENAAKIFQEYDIVLDASDNPKTRYLVNDAAVLAKVIALCKPKNNLFSIKRSN